MMDEGKKNEELEETIGLSTSFLYCLVEAPSELAQYDSPGCESPQSEQPQNGRPNNKLQREAYLSWYQSSFSTFFILISNFVHISTCSFSQKGSHRRQCECFKTKLVLCSTLAVTGSQASLWATVLSTVVTALVLMVGQSSVILFQPLSSPTIAHSLLVRLPELALSIPKVSTDLFRDQLE